MSTTNKKRTDGALALHIRRQRQWYRHRPIIQADLAYMAGLSTRILRTYETCRRLPFAIRILYATARALEVPMEQLIAPEIRERLEEQVEQRRAVYHRPRKKKPTERRLSRRA
jgi:hypothetical protein